MLPSITPFPAFLRLEKRLRSQDINSGVYLNSQPEHQHFLYSSNPYVADVSNISNEIKLGRNLEKMDQINRKSVLDNAWPGKKRQNEFLSALFLRDHEARNGHFILREM